MSVFTESYARPADGVPSRHRRAIPWNKRVTATFIALILTACGNRAVKPPDVKLNPSPKGQYMITLTLNNPPGEISAVIGNVQFNIDNEECVPITDPIAGIRKHTSFTLPFALHRTGDHYVGRIYTDQLLNEDYYGLGICRWSLSRVRAFFQTKTMERFVFLNADEIIGERRILGLCQLSDANKDICLTPLNKKLDENLQFVATLESRKVIL